MNDKIKSKDKQIRDLKETIKDPEYPKKQAQLKAEHEKIRKLYQKNHDAAVIKKRREKLQSIIRSNSK